MTGEVPLSMIPEGKTFSISRIKAGRGLARRLMELGFKENTKLTVVRAQHHGPLIVMLNNSRIAMGRGMAMKVMMKQNNNNNKTKQ